MTSPDNPDHYTVTESLAITVGDYFPVGDRMRRLTPRLAEATNAARSVLIEVAQHREVITYGELSDSIGRSVLPRHMGPLLSMIAHDCAARGEPSLASLVVSAATARTMPVMLAPVSGRRLSPVAAAAAAAWP